MAVLPIIFSGKHAELGSSGRFYRLGITIWFILFLSSLVFVIVFPWHMANQRVPIWDGADFVLNAQNIQTSFQGGVFNGIAALYSERGWRPIMFPAFAAPFFLILSGKIIPSVATTQYVCVVILATYVFLLLRDIIGDFRALVGCGIIVSLQWLADLSNVFYSELFWLAAASGVLYHLEIGWRRGTSSHFILAGIWLGIMGATRPAETVVLAVLPVGALVMHGWAYGAIRKADLAFLLLQLILAAAAAWLKTLPYRQGLLSHPALPPAMVVWAAFLIALRARRFFIEAPLLGFIVSAEAVTLAWHLPTMRTLYIWAYDTSFGWLAKLTDQKFSGLSPFSVLRELLNFYSPTVLAVLIVGSMLTITGLRRSDLTSSRSAPMMLIVTALLMAFPVAILMSLSGTSDPRRILPAVLVLYIGLVAYSLSPIGLFPRARCVIASLLMSVQVIIVAANGFDIQSPILYRLQDYTGHLRAPVTSPEPGGAVLDGLASLGIHKGRIIAFTYCYFDYANCEQKKLPAFEPMAVSTLARERRIPIYVHFVGDLDFSTPTTLAGQIKARNFDYVLIDMFDAPVAVNHDVPYVAHTDHFIALERSGLPSGLIDRGCFSSLGRAICVIEASP